MPGQFLKAFLSAYLWVKELDPLLREFGIRTDVEVEGPRLCLITGNAIPPRYVRAGRETSGPSGPDNGAGE